MSWDLIAAAGPFSALSGVLAGFLIASAAVLFAPGGRCVPYTVALLASGVPGLVLSSYIFGAISGLKSEDPANVGQTWSQGLIALALLLIGAAVLICGFSWVLVTYSEDLEYILLIQLSRDGTDKKLIQRSKDFGEIVKQRSILLVSLNGWISAGIIVTTTVVLVRANTIYIQAHRYAWDWLPKFLICIATAIGAYVIVRAVYTVSSRTHNALRRVGASDETHRVFWEGSLVAMVVVGTVVSLWMAGYKGWSTFLVSIVVTSSMYGVGRTVYWIRRRRKERATKARIAKAPPQPIDDQQSIATSGADASGPAATGGETADTIISSDKLFQIGKLAQTTANVVLLSVMGLIFAGLVMGKPMVESVRIIITLILGGLYPAAILLGLSRSVASHDNLCAVPPLLTKSIGKWIP